jgi:glycerol uptake facilitator-like aquaporin
MLGICFCSTFSTNQLNPTISLMNYFRKKNKINFSMLFIYLFSQLIGAFCGILFSHYYNGISKNAFIPMYDNIGYLFKLVVG